jgi:hypothetical protein
MKTLTTENLEKFSKRVNKELNADRKAGRLKLFTGKLRKNNLIQTTSQSLRRLKKNNSAKF